MATFWGKMSNICSVYDEIRKGGDYDWKYVDMDSAKKQKLNNDESATDKNRADK